ncbi:MAG: hypothetical protein JNJ94_06180 [Chlorobi bacterium]|nr:hypothetical protein [Chlorobiota bacterium]
MSQPPLLLKMEAAVLPSRNVIRHLAALNAVHSMAHYDRTLYIADTENSRIVRFRLTT